METKSYLFRGVKRSIWVEILYELGVPVCAKLYDCYGQSLEELSRNIDSCFFTEEQVFDRARSYIGNSFSISSIDSGELIMVDVFFNRNGESICKYFISTGSVVFEEGTEYEHYPVDKTFAFVISRFNDIECMGAQKQVVGKNHSTKCGKMNYVLEDIRDFYEHARDIRNLTGRKPSYLKLLKRHFE